MKYLPFIIVSLFIFSCLPPIQKYGKHYQKHGDVISLEKAIDLIPVGSEKTYIQEILGEPIDFGFDYRYLTDSIGENGCPIGAVFGLDEEGKVSWKSVFEICE